MTKNFKSDNYFGVHPQIWEAMMGANEGSAGSYGHDKYTEELKEKLTELFEHDVSIFLVSTGTISNCLSISALCPPYGTVYSTEEAHINNDECNAPGFYLNGSRVSMCTDPSRPSKLDLSKIEFDIKNSLDNRPHKTKPSCITVTQSTELGQVYSLAELREIQDFAKKYNLKIHMDGARFANALVTLGCTPAEMTWKVGVDILSFGCTKNGGLMGEVIVIFNKDIAEEFDYLHKRSGQLLSKTRFFAAQVLGYLRDDLWLKMARHSNSVAKKFEELLKEVPALSSTTEVPANELFIKMPKEVAEALWAEGFEFYVWDVAASSYRFVTSWATSEESVVEFIKAAKRITSK
ncbi:threonine aldolase [Tritrichomonas foetus]|uniref:Threonine aldolase n=1 Tax=Tritrichomonas foetus TaxID=1144522 RepID=A0A1J4KGD1_9EUKA|nr:threonine aldolase [Tritrichomonas foetus]|eukprot:OHT08860.1 threonine aldolase [Tritrichomonas foetus]